tara:strand:- start:13151 stop:14158 length:1008 start_codon:yes stop_codon:yes gene_type:complete
MLVFATESSCDETAVCLMKSDGSILSHKIATQEIHSKYGGVVPELASRSHLENIQHLYRDCIKEAKITIEEVDVFCSTVGPGLVGSLLIGSTFTKSLAIGCKKPFVPINHLEGHILSPTINNNYNFPFLCILLTGGHTQIYLVKSFGKYELLGETLDDALGEAFDKIAQLLNLSYPGGPEIELKAKKGNINSINLPYPLKNEKNLNFSFSGIKTAVNLFVKKNKLNPKLICNISASFQNRVSQIIIDKISLCLKELEKKEININNLAIVGGVAINKYIGLRIKEYCDLKNINIMMPPRDMFADNAAMIAWACVKRYNRKLSNINFKVDPRLTINL